MSHAVYINNIIFHSYLDHAPSVTSIQKLKIVYYSRVILYLGVICYCLDCTGDTTYFV